MDLAEYIMHYMYIHLQSKELKRYRENQKKDEKEEKKKIEKETPKKELKKKTAEVC